ncbi:hypothetical protein M9Y10_013884, partial [Tritrichomonas musculus]
EFNKELLKYASSEEIQKGVNTLRDYIVNNFALSTDIPEIPTDLVNESALTTALEPYAKLTNLSEYVKTQDLPDMTKYALSTDIPEPVDLTPYYTSAQTDEKFVDEDELAYELDKYETKDVADGKYALKSEIPEVPTDLVNESALSTALYGTELNIEYLPNITDGPLITPQLPNAGVHLIFDVNWGDSKVNNIIDDDIMHIDVIFKPNVSTSTFDNMERYDNNGKLIDIIKWRHSDGQITYTTTSTLHYLYPIAYNFIRAQIESPFIKTANVVDGSLEQFVIQCTQNDSGCVIPNDDVRKVITTKNIIVKFKRNVDDTSYEEAEYKYSRRNNVNLIYKSTSGESSDAQALSPSGDELIDIHVNSGIVSLRAEDDTLTNIYDASITLISNQPVSDDMITSVKYVNDNFALTTELARAIEQVKSEIPEPVDLSGYVAKNSLLEITSPSSNIAKFYSSVDANVITSISFGYNDVYNTDFEYKSSKVANSGELDIYVDGYKFQSFSMFGTARNTKIDSNLLVNGTITSNGSNTITHYSPIESSMNSINDFVIGAPVYMTGKVYKHDGDTWIPSTVNDTTDCICSVKTTGSWKEYVGICVRIDEKNNAITFASHGDYLLKVDDSSCYGIGDEVFIDNEDNKLKILAGQTAITSKIRRMTVGIITAIIDNKTIACFKA